MIEKAFDILSALADSAQSNNSLSAVCKMAGLPRSTTYRLLNMLINAGVVDYVQDRGYVIDTKLLIIALRGTGNHDLLKVMIPICRALCKDSGETTTLSIASGNGRVCLYQEEADTPLTRNVKVGSYGPLTVGATGGVIASGMSDEQIRMCFEKEAERGIAKLEDWDRVLKKIQKIREDGFCVSIEERYAGCGSISVPIKNQLTGAVEAALTLACAAVHITPDRIPVYLKQLQEAARQAERQLGYFM